jgi:hypothetical protein
MQMQRRSQSGRTGPDDENVQLRVQAAGPHGSGHIAFNLDGNRRYHQSEGRTDTSGIHQHLRDLSAEKSSAVGRRSYSRSASANRSFSCAEGLWPMGTSGSGNSRTALISGSVGFSESLNPIEGTVRPGADSLVCASKKTVLPTAAKSNELDTTFRRPVRRYASQLICLETGKSRHSAYVIMKKSSSYFPICSWEVRTGSDISAAACSGGSTRRQRRTADTKRFKISIAE